MTLLESEHAWLTALVSLTSVFTLNTVKNAERKGISTWLKVSILAVTLFIVIGLIPCSKRNRVQPLENENVMKSLYSLGQLLNEFHEHYGYYPRPQIPIDLQKHYPQKDRQDSNYILGQLAVFGNLDPDQLRKLTSLGRPARKSSKIEILGPGDCQLAYISNAQKDSKLLPLLMGPVIPGTTLMDEQRIGSKGAYLKVDGSIAQGLIHSQGSLQIRRGNILDHGPKTIWGDTTPQVHPPLDYEQNQIQASPLLYRLKTRQILMIGALGFVALYWIYLVVLEKRATRR